MSPLSWAISPSSSAIHISAGISCGFGGFGAPYWCTLACHELGVWVVFWELIWWRTWSTICCCWEQRISHIVSRLIGLSGAGMDIGEESGRIVDLGVLVSVLLALWT